MSNATPLYRSVPVPNDILARSKHIFFLRNYFQDPLMYEEELAGLRQRLASELPVLENDHFEPEIYQPGEKKLEDIKDLWATELRPIVLRGYVSQHDCVRTWTPEHFRDKYGDFRIFYTSTEKIINDDQMRLGDFVDRVLAGDKSRAYVENLSDIFNAFPELHDQLGLDRIGASLTGYASYHQISQFFLGGLGTGAAYHCANELNCFLNIYGRKKWTFLHPLYSIAMNPTLMNKGYFIGSPVKALAPKGFIEANFPLYNRVPKLTITLEPGDLLINPPWWWHTVKNVTPSTIAVATRWGFLNDVQRQAPLADFVQSMRSDTWVSFNEEFLKTVVVVPDEKVRKNYVSYEKMGWSGS
ncbi:cupin-like domain-containing protein [Corallococcus llansteffanensis]|uniref:JmjC domain-containing protein n=1 Tax=Corallococcus llansteffanensis TaxID=2316731 RepID=A0A3A8QIV0_9BACT|nr:cupin-like domain-containing protein [Corallococcus llansteffanensis]RKH68633.1 hypothetical protein D7V93_00940 [Corallococcus llansteffanensis]